jgi:hypothetical protein
MTEDGYDFDKLTREMVVATLRNSEKAPQQAAQMAATTITSGVLSTRARQDPRLTVIGVCRGAMSGILLIEKDMIVTAVELLRSMGNLSHSTSLDPGDLMTWAMEGIASVMPMAAPDLKTRVQEAIEENFMGAGSVFAGICAKAGKSGDA